MVVLHFQCMIFCNGLEQPSSRPVQLVLLRILLFQNLALGRFDGPSPGPMLVNIRLLAPLEPNFAHIRAWLVLNGLANFLYETLREH